MVRQPCPVCSIPTDCGETRTLASIGFVSYDPRSGKRLPKLSRKGTSAFVLRSAAMQQSAWMRSIFRRGVARVAVAELDGNVCTQLVQHAHTADINA
jgi:hypothetical protein